MNNDFLIRSNVATAKFISFLKTQAGLGSIIIAYGTIESLMLTAIQIHQNITLFERLGFNGLLKEAFYPAAIISSILVSVFLSVSVMIVRILSTSRLESELLGYGFVLLIFGKMLEYMPISETESTTTIVVRISVMLLTVGLPAHLVKKASQRLIEDTGGLLKATEKLVVDKVNNHIKNEYADVEEDLYNI